MSRDKTIKLDNIY